MTLRLHIKSSSSPSRFSKSTIIHRLPDQPPLLFLNKYNLFVALALKITIGDEWCLFEKREGFWTISVTLRKVKMITAMLFYSLYFALYLLDNNKSNHSFYFLRLFNYLTTPTTHQCWTGNVTLSLNSKIILLSITQWSRCDHNSPDEVLIAELTISLSQWKWY